MNDLQAIFAQLQSLKASELRAVISEAKRLLVRKPLYIREISKPTPNGRYIYLYATWNENGKTQQKSLGRKRELENDIVSAQEQDAVASEFADRGIYAAESVAFLRAMLTQGFYIAN
ncbi:MAG: hypothetical protein R3E79_28215 [Caldilineaceae bacterium]